MQAASWSKDTKGRVLIRTGSERKNALLSRRAAARGSARWITSQASSLIGETGGKLQQVFHVCGRWIGAIRNRCQKARAGGLQRCGKNRLRSEREAVSITAGSANLQFRPRSLRQIRPYNEDFADANRAEKQPQLCAISCRESRAAAETANVGLRRVS